MIDLKIHNFELLSFFLIPQVNELILKVLYSFGIVVRINILVVEYCFSPEIVLPLHFILDNQSEEHIRVIEPQAFPFVNTDSVILLIKQKSDIPHP
jgi:hypothetical protein